MFDDIETEEDRVEKWKAATHRSQQTAVLVGAMKALEELNFEKWMGSGVVVTLSPITHDKVICESFMVRAEDMELIKPALIASIKEQLSFRTNLLKYELKQIEELLK